MSLNEGLVEGPGGAYPGDPWSQGHLVIVAAPAQGATAAQRRLMVTPTYTQNSQNAQKLHAYGFKTHILNTSTQTDSTQITPHTATPHTPRSIHTKKYTESVRS